MTQRPVLDAASPAATAVLDPPEPLLLQPRPGGYYDPDSSSFQPAEVDSSEWLTLAVNLEPETSVPADQR